jgi:hypothetical protein
MQRQRLCFFPLGKKQTIDSTQERDTDKERKQKKIIKDRREIPKKPAFL